MIGYLTGSALIDLIESGGTSCLYSISSTHEHLGDVTAVYFFDSNNREIAHQTMFESKNKVTKYSRSWGNSFNGERLGYKLSHRFQMLLQMHENGDIIPFAVYRVV